MVATTTITTKGVSIKTDDPSITGVSILADIDLRQGTPVDETAWLDGGAAADAYPGALTPFQAKNTNTTNAGGGLRLVTIAFTMVDADIADLQITAGLSKILSIIGTTMTLEDKAFAAIFTNTGTEGNATTAPISTGGANPNLRLHAEAGTAGTVTILCF